MSAFAVTTAMQAAPRTSAAVVCGSSTAALPLRAAGVVLALRGMALIENPSPPGEPVA